MICVSLSGLSYDDCSKAIDRAEFAEIRIDQLELSGQQLKELFAKKKKSVATCRPGNYNDNQRLTILKAAIDAGAGYIDIEYESETRYREELTLYAHDHNSLVIISYHNFDETPSLTELDSIIYQSKKWNADIVKITTTANNKMDCSKILSLYAKHENICAFCMGNFGKITRIAAPFLGAKFTYASVNNKLATAPGQLTLDELGEIYKIMK